MTKQDLNIDTYFSLTEEEKENFYNIITNNKKSTNKTTKYYTLIKPARQAIIPKIRYHQKNGKLTFIAPLKRKDKNVSSLFYLCLCDCNKWDIVDARSFRIEKQITCYFCSNKKMGQKHIKDISGQIFGQLQAIEPTEKRGKDGSVYWKCKCINCGHEQIVIKYNLIKTKLGHLCAICGNKSAGEEKIKNFLLSNNIPFTIEKSFSDCLFPDTKCLARFDFYVNNQYIIEIDGEQHFRPVKFSKEVTDQEALLNFQKIQQRDSFKNNWCKEHNLPLIRIPYWFFKNEEINKDIIDYKKSKFLVKFED